MAPPDIPKHSLRRLHGLRCVCDVLPGAIFQRSRKRNRGKRPNAVRHAVAVGHNVAPSPTAPPRPPPEVVKRRSARQALAGVGSAGMAAALSGKGGLRKSGPREVLV